LREKGIAKANKKAGAIATEGVVKILIEGDKALLIEINSQTDFVAMNNAFIELSNKITECIFKHHPNSVEQANGLIINNNQTIEHACHELTAKIGEKIAIRRFVFVTKNNSEKFATYIHNNRKIGVILVASQSSNETAIKDASMHAAAMNPKFLNASQVNQT
jgi:elongation factor Ts